MKVKELMAALAKVDPELDVFVDLVSGYASLAPDAIEVAPDTGALIRPNRRAVSRGALELVRDALGLENDADDADDGAPEHVCERMMSSSDLTEVVSHMVVAHGWDVRRPDLIAEHLEQARPRVLALRSVAPADLEPRVTAVVVALAAKRASTGN